MENDNEESQAINNQDPQLTNTATSASMLPSSSRTFIATTKHGSSSVVDHINDADTDSPKFAQRDTTKPLANFMDKDDNTTSSESASPRSEFDSSTQNLLSEHSDTVTVEKKELSLRERTIEEIMKAHLESKSTAAHAAIVSAHKRDLNESSTNPSGDGCVDDNTPTGFTSIAHHMNDVKNETDSNEKVDLSKLDAKEGNAAEAPSCTDATELGELDNESTPTASIRSIGSFVCRICHNAENPERLVSPCLCKGSLTYVHIQCLERWISTSRNTTCELCQFQYNTEQTLRYTCLQSLRMWYARSMSRRALQEDCQMFSLLTLVAFGIIGTLLVGIQYYYLQGRSWGIGRLWTKGWLVFFLFSTMAVYFINIYMIVRSQLAPWYRWWQSARDIKLILENRKPFRFRPTRRIQNRPTTEATTSSVMSVRPASQVQQYPQQQQPFVQQQQQPCAFQSATTMPAASTPNPTTTMLSPHFAQPMSLHLQFNRNVAMAIAAAAAIAEFDGYNVNSNNNNSSNNINSSSFINNNYINSNNINNTDKYCADFATAPPPTPTPTIANVELANVATAVTVNGVAAAAVEIPLDAVVYELATAL